MAYNKYYYHHPHIIIIIIIIIIVIIIMLCKTGIWPTLKKRTVLWNVTKVNLKKKIKIQKYKSEANKIQLRNKK